MIPRFIAVRAERRQGIYLIGKGRRTGEYPISFLFCPSGEEAYDKTSFPPFERSIHSLLRALKMNMKQSSVTDSIVCRYRFLWKTIYSDYSFGW